MQLNKNIVSPNCNLKVWQSITYEIVDILVFYRLVTCVHWWELIGGDLAIVLSPAARLASALEVDKEDHPDENDEAGDRAKHDTDDPQIAGLWRLVDYKRKS